MPKKSQKRSTLALSRPEQLSLVGLHDGLPLLEEQTDISEVQYAAGRLVQCTLPHSDPGNLPVWQKASSSMVLTIRPWYEQVSGIASTAVFETRYPYGTIPRLLLYWLVTEAVRGRNRRIELGANMSQFTRRVGLDSESGGSHSDTYRLKNQTKALFRAAISTDIHALSEEERLRWINMDVTHRADMWWKPQAGWQGWIDLGEEFFDNITRGPVPLSFDVLRAKEIRRSPLALDLYAYLTHRSYIALKLDRPLPIAWTDLHEQLGSNYRRVTDFRVKASFAIAKLLPLYPALRLRNDGDNLIVYPALPSVPVVF